MELNSIDYYLKAIELQLHSIEVWKKANDTKEAKRALNLAKEYLDAFYSSINSMN